MANEEFLLKWNDHHNAFFAIMQDLCTNEILTDVTIACGGQIFETHKLMLCVCSGFFRSVLTRRPDRHPIVFLKDIKAKQMEQLLQYMYHGEINVLQEDLAPLVEAARALQIKGLADAPSKTENRERELREQRERERQIAAKLQQQQNSLLHGSLTGAIQPPHKKGRKLANVTNQNGGSRSNSQTGGNLQIQPSQILKQTLSRFATHDDIAAEDSDSNTNPPHHWGNQGGNSDNDVSQGSGDYDMNAGESGEGQYGDEENMFGQHSELGDGDGGSSGTVGGGNSGGGPLIGNVISAAKKMAKQAAAAGSGGRTSSASGGVGGGVNTTLSQEQLDKMRYKCEICGKAFVTPSKLQRHTYSHTGVRPFGCDVCGKSFSQSANLKTHQRNTHPEMFPNDNKASLVTMPMELGSLSPVPITSQSSSPNPKKPLLSTTSASSIAAAAAARAYLDNMNQE